MNEIEAFLNIQIGILSLKMGEHYHKEHKMSVQTFLSHWNSALAREIRQNHVALSHLKDGSFKNITTLEQMAKLADEDAKKDFYE